jgi:fibronectin type 3 domain-containing protein
MKKLTLVPLTLISALLLNGCNPSALTGHQLDLNLPKINNVKAVAGSTYVAFEWQSLANKGLDGVNIYRTEGDGTVYSKTKQLVKVGTVSNRFSSHYVDTALHQNSRYTYTFTTIKGGFESAHGQVIDVKTLPPFDAVTFFQAFQKAPNTIKMIWRPHSDKRVKMYKIERSINGQPWKWVDSVKHRMMSEFIDTYVAPGNSYAYRIIAVGFDDSISKPSKVVTILAR